MPFGVATVLTNLGKATLANRLLTTPTRQPPKYVAMGTGATAAARTAAATDTVLSAEVETRVSGTETTVTTAQPGDTYEVVGTITATGNRALDEGALFDASSGGNMVTSATYNVINLTATESIQFTWHIQST